MACGVAQPSYIRMELSRGIRWTPTVPSPGRITARVLEITAVSSPSVETQRPWKTNNGRLVLEDGSIWEAKSFGALGTQVGVDLISDVSCEAPYEWSERTNPEWEFNNNSNLADKFHVVAYDFGIKHNILRRLASYGCKVTVVPSTWSASETLKMKPDGVLFSNGPGDPAAVPYAVETVKEIIGKVPVFGICMGHQLLEQALGGKTFKMKFGHHGGNHPVKNLKNGRVEISAQNHNYAVDPATLPAAIRVTHKSLNDGSCAGLACPEWKLMSLQYHLEASPGPHDSDSIFGEFNT